MSKTNVPDERTWVRCTVCDKYVRINTINHIIHGTNPMRNQWACPECTDKIVNTGEFKELME